MEFEIDFLESHDEASLVGEMQRVSGVLRKSKLTADDIDRVGRVSSKTLMEKFGTLRRALEAAGLVSTRYTLSTDEELMTVVANLWRCTLRDSGRRPRASEVRKYGCPVSSKTIMLRFGTWKKALAATARWAKLPDAERLVSKVKPRPTKRRRKISDRKRYLVLKRDRYTCRVCRQSGCELEVDHIVPVCRGGSDSIENLQALCKPCNRGKGGNLE